MRHQMVATQYRRRAIDRAHEQADRAARIGDRAAYLIAEGQVRLLRRARTQAERHAVMAGLFGRPKQLG